MRCSTFVIYFLYEKVEEIYIANHLQDNFNKLID